jgi:hypothetical protein
VPARGGVEDRLEHVDVGERQRDLEEEAVDLRLGQHVGALHLDRVLRRQDEEWDGQTYSVPATVTVPSCIASRSADCVFGVARLISSASTICAKIGPCWKLVVASPPGPVTSV